MARVATEALEALGSSRLRDAVRWATGSVFSVGRPSVRGKADVLGSCHQGHADSSHERQLQVLVRTPEITTHLYIFTAATTPSSSHAS